MEPRLSVSEHRVVVTRSTTTLNPWRILPPLLAIGRPVSLAELASCCTHPRASPETIEFLCSMNHSPLRLTEDLLVTLSPVAYSVLGHFLLNSTLVSSFLRRISELEGLRPKRNWDDYVRKYYRKRKRSGSEFYLPEAKREALSRDVDRNEEVNQAALVLRNRYQSDYTTISSCGDNNMLVTVDEPLNEAPALLPDFGELETIPLLVSPLAERPSYGLMNVEHETITKADMFSSAEHFKCVPKSEDCSSIPAYEAIQYITFPVTVKRIMANMPHLESASTADEGIEVNHINSDSVIKFDETFRWKSDERIIVQQVGSLERRNEESFFGFGFHGDGKYFPTVTTEIDMYSNHESTGKIIPECTRKNLPVVKGKKTAHLGKEAVTSVHVLPSEKKSMPSSPKSNTRRHQPSPKTLENSKDGSFLVEHQQRKPDNNSIALERKLKHNYDKRTSSKQNKENTKENAKSVSIPLNSQLQSNLFPSFESFVVEAQEGSGGYGTVYRAQRKIDAATFAIKFPHENANKHHVHNELKMLERFGGKNFVIKFEGSFKNENSECIVLEYAEHDRPEALKKEIDVFEIQWYAYCMFRALAVLHKQGVVHRDVKPGNFLFSRKLNKGYLIDFNLAIDLHQKYGTPYKSKVACAVNVKHPPLQNTKSLSLIKGRKSGLTKHSETVNQKVGKSYHSLSILQNPKGKTDEAKAFAKMGKGIIRNQGADGSGITSAKEATSARTPSAERLREPIPCQGRKELINLVQEALQGPQEAESILVNTKKKPPQQPEKVDKKLVYLTPMPLRSTGRAVAGAGLLSNKGDGKHKREGPCVGTKGFRAPEVLLRSPYQGTKVDIWSAGVTLLYMLIGRTPFGGEPDQNIKEIAKLRGSEELWEVAKLHNRESLFPAELFDLKSLQSLKLQDWCRRNTRRPEFLEHIPRSLFDLVDKCLTCNPRSRISAEDALRHEFLAPCHEALKKQKMMRRGLSLESAATHLLPKQAETCDGYS